MLVLVHEQLYCAKTPLPTVLGPWACTVLEDGTERSHQPNKVDFANRLCLGAVRIAYRKLTWTVLLLGGP